MKINVQNSQNLNLKYKNSKSSQNNHSVPNFSGHVLTTDSQGNDVYKFFYPNLPSDSRIQIAKMSKDNNGYYKVEDVIVNDSMPEGYRSYDFKIKSDSLNDKDVVLGYKLQDKFGSVYKENSMTGDSEFTIANPVNSTHSNKPRVMEHILIDAFNAKNSNVKRNHFNLLGGTLNSLNEKLNILADAGVTDVLGTPVFGQDNKSSQGYWTTNPYQITNNLGNITDFRNLMVKMFQKNMRWTADGAFVNEGFEGIHIRDIMTNGAKSPFIPMFSTCDLENLPARFGVLSKDEAVNKHTHIKVVNGPVFIQYEKKGDVFVEKIVRGASYDKNKPTLIQIFDDRLASEKQINGNYSFDVYDNKDTGDNLAISNYRDSVQAYHFSVNPAEVRANYENYKEIKKQDKNIEVKDFLTKWSNKEVVNSNKDGGIATWVGNSDISKKRYMIPESVLDKSDMSEDKKSLIRAAQYEVQDDTIQVGKFWTNEVGRTLTEYAARELGNKVKEKHLSYQDAITALVTEGKLSKESLSVLKKDGNKSPLENILTVDNFDGKRKYSLKPTVMPKSLTDGMMSFPMDSVEFSPDLVSILSYPYIKNMAVSEDTVGKSRYELYGMGDKYYNQMPQKYRKLYKQADNIIASEMKNQAKSIMQNLGSKTGVDYIAENGKLTTQGREVYALLAPDIAKFLIVTALAPKIKPKGNSQMLEYDVKDLQNVSLNSLNLQYDVAPEITAERLLEKLQKGIDAVSENKKEDFVKLLYNRVKNVDSDSINVAKLIMEKNEAGLGWRIDASKDVGEWDAVTDGKYDNSVNISKIMGFWNKFNTSINKYNPNSIKIGELTNWNYTKQSEFLTNSKFDETSDYETFYSFLPQLYGQDESGAHEDSLYWNFASKLENKFNKNNNCYFESGNLQNINYSHRFVSNHDKPRILHQLAVNLSAFNKDKAGEVRNVLAKGLWDSSTFNSLSDDRKNVLMSALDNLKKGIYYIDGEKKQFDAEKFGVRPFDFNIDAIFKEAAEENRSFKIYLDTVDGMNTVKKIKSETLQNILQPAMKKYRAIWFAMNALPGAPTNYAGDELGMTGFETPCKNEHQENRNALHWDWLKDNNYKFIQNYKSNIDAISKIRTKNGASALNNGSTVLLNKQELIGGGEAVALFRYNDETDAVCVLHNKGYGAEPWKAGQDASMKYIDLGGLWHGLPVGTIYVDALNPNDKYKVTSSHKIEKVNNANTDKVEGNINLGDAGIILLRDRDYGNNVFSFKGRIEDSKVKLANTKYNFSYMTK